MNIVFYCILFFLFFSSCNSIDNDVDFDLFKSSLTSDLESDKVSLPDITFDKEVFDFGEISQEKSINIEFRFKNIGTAPLLIRSVKGSCGCTIPSWPKETIDIGESGAINVTFNSGEKVGKQKKTVTLVTNAIPSTKVLTITGTILVP